MAEMLMSGLKDILIHLSKNYGRMPLKKENAKIKNNEKSSYSNGKCDVKQ